tara:strand:+ start:13990 stop:15018 length:1029 start_codon:yes stop_codon:yes gene_type:complete
MLQQFYIFRKLYYALAILLGIIIMGVFGFHFVEGYTFEEAFYMTIITVSTVGFSEVRPLSQAGRMFTSFLIITSFGTFAYAASVITGYVLDGEFQKHLKTLRINRNLKKMKNHIIVCGYGRNGKQAVEELKDHNLDFLVIEQDQNIIDELSLNKDINAIYGDATSDETLEAAGIHKAKALITTLPNDADNLFVVLTARALNQNILIISRASKDSSDKKLRVAGANNVIMPDKIGGAHMASLVVRPDVIEFIDYVMGQGSGTMNLEEIIFEEIPQEYQGKSIREINFRDKTGANIVGLKLPSGEYIINPDPAMQIKPGTKIFVLGDSNQIEAFKNVMKLKEQK